MGATVGGFTVQLLRKYGVSTPVYFFLADAATDAFETAAVHAAGDTQISKDGAAFANTVNGFTHVGNGMYALTLTATEMQAATIDLSVVDAEGVWDPIGIHIDTYGFAFAQHEFDLDNPNPVVGGATTAGGQNIADAILNRNLGSGTDSGGRTVRNALRPSVNRTRRVGATLEVYEEDDTSLAWQAAISASANDPISEINPA